MTLCLYLNYYQDYDCFILANPINTDFIPFLHMTTALLQALVQGWWIVAWIRTQQSLGQSQTTFKQTQI